jgi:uncharacterized membrane protein YdjX (TVP38/TMEM64 family)
MTADDVSALCGAFGALAVAYLVGWAMGAAWVFRYVTKKMEAQR